MVWEGEGGEDYQKILEQKSVKAKGSNNRFTLNMTVFSLEYMLEMYYMLSQIFNLYYTVVSFQDFFIYIICMFY